MLVDLALLAAAVWATLRYYRERPSTVAPFLAVLLLVSAVPAVLLAPPLRLLPSTTVLLPFAAVVVALGWTYSTERFRDPEATWGQMDVAYLAPLLLLALATLYHPPSAFLLIPLMLSFPRSASKALRGMALALAAIAFLAAGYRLYRDGAWESMLHSIDPSLLTWSAVDLFAGQSFGLVVWYLPALLLIISYRPGGGRGWLLASVALGTVLLVLTTPHDFRGGEGFHVNVAFLPLYGALWFVPARVPKLGATVATAVLAGLFLWPAWLAPLATARGDDRPASHRYSLASYLPYETTQQFAPRTTEWQGTGVLSRSLGPGLEDSEQGPVLVPRNGPAQVMIASERPLEAVLFDFGPRSKTELLVDGGEVGNTVFKPDGGVRFEVTVESAARTHPMWFSDIPHSVYLFELEMPDGPERPLPVAILARPKDALPRSLDPKKAGE